MPSRFMVGTISFVQTALADVLRQELADPEEALRAATAWNKMLMVQLDILLAGYLTETPTEPQEISAKEGGAARASPNGTAAATTLAARIAMALRFIS